MRVVNRVKGLELLNSVLEELQMEVHNIVQESANKTIPKKKNSKKAKWLSEEALQIARERREVKSKGERERYIQLNAGFQRTAWRDKKAFFKEQCINKKKTAERERLEIFSGKLELSREHFAQRWA